MNEQTGRKFCRKGESVEIWYCRFCRQVHFRRDETLLSFTRQEFEELTNKVVDIYCGQIISAGLKANDGSQFPLNGIPTAR